MTPLHARNMSRKNVNATKKIQSHESQQRFASSQRSMCDLQSTITCVASRQRSRDQRARVHDAIWVDRLLHDAHQRERLRVLEAREVARTGDADAVFSRDGAVEPVGDLVDRMREALARETGG